MYKILLFIGLFIFMSCTGSTTNVKPPVSEETLDVTPQVAEPAELNVDQLMQEIDAETAELTPSESDVTIQDINACNVKDYKGIKKYVFCFAGGMNAQEGVFYYVDGKSIAARYTLEQYNASPANLAEHDESKTIKTKVVLYFKDGDLRKFDKILDEHKQVVTLDERQTEEWEILIAAIQ